MNQLNIALCVLSWRSHKTLINTLNSYKTSKLLDIAAEKLIFFQEATREDAAIGQQFGFRVGGNVGNVGIGAAFTEMCKHSTADFVLILENDWVNIETSEKTELQLRLGAAILGKGEADMIKYRHRTLPGEPLYTTQYQGREMALPTHLLDSVHWINYPELHFPEYIKRRYIEGEDWFFASSRNANFTNNPTMFKREFYVNQISPFSGGGIDLEGKIGDWWIEQNFTVAQSDGLFSHMRIDR